MAAGLTAENVVNTALRRIGYPTPVGSLYEGSAASRAALDVYAETISALLRTEDHEFSRKVAALSVSGNVAPLYWSFEYLYPADCIRVRQVIPASQQAIPLPIAWDVGTSQVSAVQTTVIWSNVATASLIYTTSAVTEADWDPGFVETVVQYLVVALGAVLIPKDDKRGNADAVDMARSIRADVGKDS